MPRPSARLNAQVTGKAREVGPAEAHERNVLAVTRRIHTKQRRLREALATVKRLRQELRHDRRELRAVLQHKADVTDEQLEVAGKADGVDRAVALAEARRQGQQHLASCLFEGGRWFCAADCPHHVIVDVDAEREVTEAEAREQIDEILGGGK